MERNSSSVLQQLSSNPQLIGQLQNLLSLLAAEGRDDAASMSTTAKLASGSSTASTSISSPSMTTAATGGGVPSPALATAPSLVRTQQQQQWQGDTAGPHRPLTQTRSSTRSGHRGEVGSSQVQYTAAETSASNGVSLQRYEQLAGRCRQLEEQLEQKKREASGAAQRASQLEKETARLWRRVEQLVTVVEGQKQKLEENAAKHELERAELANRHAVEMRSRAAEHNEALRRLMSAQRLVTAAGQYEQTVNAATRQLSVATTPVNKGLPSRFGSSMKQRQKLRNDVGRNNNNNKKEEEMDEDSKGGFVARVPPVKRERESASSSLPASRRTGRTPRTPSPTVADRVAAANSHHKKTPQSTMLGLDSAHTCVAASQTTPTSTVTETMARYHHHQQQQQQQQQHDAENHVKSSFVAQYSPVALPPVATAPLPAPLPLSTTASSSLGALSRTPRQRKQPQTYQLQQHQRPRSAQSSGTSSVVGGPTRSPSPVNPKRGAVRPRFFVLTGLTEKERADVKEAVAAIAAVGQHGVVMESDREELPPFVATHIIVRGPPRSVKALCGVVASKWLVQPEYIFASREAGFWLDEHDEGGLLCFPPPLKCQRFLLTMPDRLVKEKLEQVIEYGGGEVVRPAHDGRSYDQGVVVITSGDDLLRFVTRME